jgi:hypothetical protein
LFRNIQAKQAEPLINFVNQLTHAYDAKLSPYEKNQLESIIVESA